MAVCLLFRQPDCLCGAVRGRHLPTIYERDRYCRANPEDCPTLRLQRLCGRPLREEEYWNLWLPEVTV